MNRTRHKFGGSWTDQKLECVRKYLKAYTTIMNKQRFQFAYIDAFAGTGYRETKSKEDADVLVLPGLASPEAVDFRNGSARNALEVEPPFKKYILIEKDAKKFVDLQELRKEFLLKDEFSEDMIECINGEANEYLKDLCQKDWKFHRALVFLDPYGMQVEWETIQAIAHTQAIDLWILFPLGTVNRLLKTDKEIETTMQASLNSLFGESDWYDVFYPVALSLLYEEQREKSGDIFATIEQYFIQRLEGIFESVASNPLSLRNSNNSALYLLCFAAGNPRGAETAVKIAEDVLNSMRNPFQATLID